MAPVLASWASLGLVWAPSAAQVGLIRRHSPSPALRLEAASLLRRLPRARARGGHSAVYNLVRSLLDALRVVVAAWDARRPPAAPGAGVPSEGQVVPPERPTVPGRSGADPPLERPPGGLLDRLRRAGLRRDLGDEWEHRP